MPALPFCVIPVPIIVGAVSSEAAGRSASHLGEFKHIAMTWQSSSGSASHIVRGDFGSVKSIDFAGLLGTNAQGPTTWTLRLGATEAEVVNGTGVYNGPEEAVTGPSATRPDNIYHGHMELPAVYSARWWQIGIYNHSGVFEASKLILGKRITPLTFYNPGFEFGVDDRGSIEFSRFGVASEDPGAIFRTLKMKFGWLSEADYETKFRPLDETLGRRKPALWCFDPTPNTYRQSRTYFGVLKEPPYATGGVNSTRYEKEYQILSMI